jgi:hypothetical protein
VSDDALISFEGELEDNMILCAFVIECPEECTVEQRNMIRKQWAEVVLMPAVNAMRKFVLQLDIPGVRELD